MLLKAPADYPVSGSYSVLSPDLMHYRATYEISQTQPFSYPQGSRLISMQKTFKPPRFLVVTEAGDIIVSSTSEGSIKLLRDIDADGKRETVTTLITDLSAPQGLVFDGAVALLQRAG